MKTLLIQPAPTYIGEIPPPGYFPLGLAYVASAARDAGHEVEVLDLWADRVPSGEIEARIAEHKFDVVGITAMSAQYRQVRDMAKIIRAIRPDARIVVGGALARHNYTEVLQTTVVDVCVFEWGEVVFPQLLESLDDLSDVPGVAYIRDGKVAVNPTVGVFQDVDNLPLPAWDLFPMDIYTKPAKIGDGHAVSSMSVVTSRGCPYNCRFCSKNFQKVNMRSIDSVIAEIKTLKERFGIGCIEFEDELVMISKKRMLELCEKIRPLKLKWACSGRANIASVELLREMKRAGCFSVYYGLESGSPTILDLMDKRVTVEMNERAIMATRKAGIVCRCLMMIGFPGETRETFRETVDFCKRNHVHPRVEFNVCTPLPGSVLYQRAISEGKIKDKVAFLEQLEGLSDVVVNMTEMSDDELMELKEAGGIEAREHYYRWRRRNPSIMMKDGLKKIQRIAAYAKVWGFSALLREGVKRLRNDREALLRTLLRAEY